MSSIEDVHVTRVGGPLDFVVLAGLYEPRQPVDGVPDVHEAAVERGETEPHRVRWAEVRDHVGALDQGAAEAPAVVVSEGNVPRRAGSRGVFKRNPSGARRSS